MKEPTGRYVAQFGHFIFESKPNNICSYSLVLVESANIQCIFLGLIRPGLEPTVYHTQCAHAYHYTTDTVLVTRTSHAILIKDEVLLTVSCPIFPSIFIAKNLLTGSLKNRSIDNLETQKKSISMKNSQFFDYLLYAKSK